MIEFVGGTATISSAEQQILKASKIILPGVGAFDSGMKNLNSSGLIPILRRKVLDDKVPLLGICLGAQLLTRKSQEGTLPGLGFFEADSVRFEFGACTNLKVPHMGWNTLHFKRSHPVFGDLNELSRVYFSHSYHPVCDSLDDVLATSFYGYEFASIIQRDNIIGTQFHPEKSHRYGVKFFEQFVSIF